MCRLKAAQIYKRPFRVTIEPTQSLVAAENLFLPYDKKIIGSVHQRVIWGQAPWQTDADWPTPIEIPHYGDHKPHMARHGAKRQTNELLRIQNGQKKFRRKTTVYGIIL